VRRGFDTRCGRSLLALLLGLCCAAQVSGCKKDEAKASSAKPTDDTAAKDAATVAADGKTGTAEADTDSEASAEAEIAWPSEPSALIKALEERKQLIDQREREIARREDKVAQLELEAVSKVDELRALRDEVRKTMADLEATFKAEADKYALQEAKKKAAAEAVEQKKTAEEKAADMARVEAEKEAVLAVAEARKARLNQLVATLKGMRPAAGGEMLASMSESDAVEVLGMLAPRLAASLLGAMPADKSARLAGRLIGSNEGKDEKQTSTDNAAKGPPATPPAPAPGG
jgi:flagellar motility protein MotE (MotC chaperone)